MHTARATAAAVTAVLGAGAAAVAAGRLAGGAALGRRPGRTLPSGPRLTVHAAGEGRITLTRHLASLRPGVHGLTGESAHAVVGEVLDDGGPRAPDTVVRRLLRVTGGALEPGARVRLTPQVHVGDPATALGIDHEDVTLPGELGPLPAWFVPGARDVWVITVHGLGTTREHPMVVMELLHRLRPHVLDVSYRGDAGAPAAPEGLGRLGETEWHDVEAAVRHAVRRGARRIVLHGWSTGATMALYTAAFSKHRDLVTGLVLDSPVLDWRATVRALARAGHVPGPLLPLAVRAAEGRTGLDGHLVADAAERTRALPTLVIHGPGDHIAPFGPSRRFAERPGALTGLHTVYDAAHAAMWNAAPERYEETLRRFLVPLL
ncbi:alpha/beta hydrolase family protein [Streptomyces sp. NPDC050560]|uniref:alpha/beta hydrolase family protein n=1 Tax=Streptomyces sp. NPDC050560 TaxID=3365630 RepID=UPI0037AE8ED2